MDREQSAKAVCLAKEENGHAQAYLTWCHQGDGFNYYKCEMCGWIKPDMKSPVILEREKKIFLGACYEQTCPQIREAKIEVATEALMLCKLHNDDTGRRPDFVGWAKAIIKENTEGKEVMQDGQGNWF